MGNTNLDQRKINYQSNMKKSEECTKQALDHYRSGDFELAAFYYNAAAGYERKARRQ